MILCLGLGNLDELFFCFRLFFLALAPFIMLGVVVVVVG